MLVRDIRDIAAQAASRRQPRLRAVRICPAGHSAPLPPRCILGPADSGNLWDIAQTETPEIACYTLQDAVIAPTGIPVAGGVALHGQAFLHPRHLVVEISDRLNAETLPRRHEPGPLAVICGPAHETWGHWLTDFLPRLWVLQAAGHDLAALRYLVPDDLRDFAWQLLRMFGLRDDQLVRAHHWREVLHTDLAILPAGLRLHNRFAPCFAEATQFVTARLRAGAGHDAAGPAESLFLSREQAPQDRAMRNRADIARLAEAHGMRIVVPERLSLAGQIALFSTARLIAGEYGSALHNSVFMPPGAQVLALRGTRRHPDFVQSGIATALGQDLAYVFGATEGGDAAHGFTVAPEHVAHALRVLGAPA